MKACPTKDMPLNDVDDDGIGTDSVDASRSSSTHGENYAVLRTHRNLPPFCSFLHQNAGVLCTNATIS